MAMNFFLDSGRAAGVHYAVSRQACANVLFFEFLTVKRMCDLIFFKHRALNILQNIFILTGPSNAISLSIR